MFACKWSQSTLSILMLPPAWRCIISFSSLTVIPCFNFEGRSGHGLTLEHSLLCKIAICFFLSKLQNTLIHSFGWYQFFIYNESNVGFITSILHMCVLNLCSPPNFHYKYHTKLHVSFLCVFSNPYHSVVKSHSSQVNFTGQCLPPISFCSPINSSLRVCNSAVLLSATTASC